MPKFQTISVYQLLRLAVFLEGERMEKSGFEKLVENINHYSSKSENQRKSKKPDDENSDVIKLKFLQNLSSNLHKNLKSGEPLISKNPSRINLILHYLDFQSWDHFFKVQEAFSGFVKPESFKEKEYEQFNIALYGSNESLNVVRSYLMRIKEQLTVPFRSCQYPSFEIKDQINEIHRLLETYPVLFWVIDSKETGNLLKVSKEFLSLCENGQVVPIWINGNNPVVNQLSNLLKPEKLIRGINQLLLSFIFMESVLQTDIQVAPEEESNALKISPSIKEITNSGVLFLGDYNKINSNNMVLGDIQSQTNIDKRKPKEEND